MENLTSLGRKITTKLFIFGRGGVWIRDGKFQNPTLSTNTELILQYQEVYLTLCVSWSCPLMNSVTFALPLIPLLITTTMWCQQCSWNSCPHLNTASSIYIKGRKYGTCVQIPSSTTTLVKPKIIMHGYQISLPTVCAALPKTVITVDITCNSYPGGKDHEHMWITSGECMVIAHELPCDTVLYCPKSFISGSIEN